MPRSLLRSIALAIAVLAVAVAAGTARRRPTSTSSIHSCPTGARHRRPSTDASLVNGWGLSAGPTTPWWASNNGTNTSTLYSGTGAKAALTVAVPGGPPGPSSTAARRTSSSARTARAARRGSCSRPEAGTILGWTPTVNGTVAVVGADRSSVGAIYKGLAIANDRLYATDFHNGRVDVFDASFKLVATAGGFKDAKVAEGLRAVRDPGARRQHLRHLREAGRRREGRRRRARAGVRRRVHARRPARRARRQQRQEERAAERAVGPRDRAGRASASSAATCWSATSANGRISAYTKRGNTWVYKGQLRLADGTPIAIDGLWAIAFGNGSAAGPTNTLYFLAGPSDERHGLFGSITAG